MKIFKVAFYTIALTIANPSVYGQVVDLTVKKSKADTTQLKIGNSKEVTGLVTYEELDMYRYAAKMSDSSGVSKTSANSIIKKVRLDVDELKTKLPMAVYEYPDGTLEIDYDALISILLLRCNKNSALIQNLQIEIAQLNKET